MNHALVEQIAEGWKLAAPPVRPSPATVEAFRAVLPREEGWRGLVQGATPEVVDLMLSREAGRVVCMDLHPETIEAMRTLGSQDWSQVEILVGDWTDDQPELRSAFDIVISDGGPLFVPFPSGWSRLFETTHRQLAPGGKAVFRTWVEPSDSPPFDEYYEAALTRFEERRPSNSTNEQEDLFVQLVSEVKSASMFGTIDADGTILANRIWPAWQGLETDLKARYGEGPLRAVISALFDRTNPVGADGVHLVSAPGEKLFRPVLENLGFVVDVVTLDEPDTPRWNVVVTGTKA